MTEDKERIGTTKLVRVRKHELIEKLRENKEAHRDVFLAAQEGYKARAVEELEKALERARNGTATQVYIHLPFPEDHTKDYEHVIAMVEMSVDDLFELTQEEFSRYVLDDWAWKAGFTQVASSYTAMEGT